MGASAKRKREKAAAFTKPKLRVGKSKPKADNYTSTSFSSARINLKTQSLSTSAPNAHVLALHQVSLLRNRSAGTRHDALAHLANLEGRVLKGVAGDAVVKLPGLVHDESASVREALLSLLRRLSTDALESVRPVVGTFLLWARAGLTHLSWEIRGTGAEVVEWLVGLGVTRIEAGSTEGSGRARTGRDGSGRIDLEDENAQGESEAAQGTDPGELLFSTPNSWTGLLRAFTSAFGWQDISSTEPHAKGWSAQARPTSEQRPGSQTKVLSKQLHAVNVLLSAGLVRPKRLDAAEGRSVYLPPMEYHRIVRRPNACAHLNLFGTPSEGNRIWEDRGERRRAFREDGFERTIKNGVEGLRSEGGELGRGASSVLKTVQEGMKDFEDE